MSSNKALRISLKIRLALLYTLLFFISCSMIFVVASLRIYREVNRMGDDELLRIADNIQEIYANALEPIAILRAAREHTICLLIPVSRFL